MPPALHPKSNFTTTLFTTTLALSFLVVGLPHMIPCPVDTKQYAQGKMRGLDQHGRAVRPPAAMLRGEAAATETRQEPEAVGQNDHNSQTSQSGTRKNRECPVPKPNGFIGEMFGFKRQDEQKSEAFRIRIEPGKRDESR